MATESADGFMTGHVRSVTVTSLSTLAGVLAALASSALVSAPPAEAATSTFALYALVGFVLVQFPVLRLVGVDVEEFGAKDILYVVFMTFSLWFVTWTILLTSGVSI